MAKLYFATNRNYEGDNRWNPKSYGKKFSSDGHYNLRFGELELDVDQAEVDKCLTKKFKGGRTGDGEKLTSYLTKRAKEAKITAYQDATADAKETIEFENNSSTLFFKNLKAGMEQNRDVLIYIHGYNVSWYDAVGTAKALEYMLNRNTKDDDKKVMVVLFSWPSDGSMMPFAAYKSDRSDARDSGQAIGRAILKLKDFLTQVHTNAEDEFMRPCLQQIHLLTHSMGNYVLQNSLKKIQGYSNTGGLPKIFENIFLCAADVNDDCLEKGEPMEKVHQLANHISVYFNKGDLAMYISDYTKGNRDRLGHSGAAKPGAIHNKIHQVSCSKIVRGLVEHSYYMWATVNDDIQMTIHEVPFDDETRQRKRLANSREWELF